MAAKRLVPGALLETAASAYYTCPSGKTAVVQKATLCNTTGGTVAVSLFLVPAGGSPGVSNQVASGVSVAAGDTISLRDEVNGHVIEAGGALHASASVGSGVCLMVSGEEL